ncbi:MAG: undecaprenyl-diphosphate phosphatase [Marinilabiliaceae bacterium]|nr:undecaprenyl-diphosphate phosphatase [Marinilabiliaceae bacterium]
MDTFQAFWLGLLQGFTEYLPVSSSGHLAIGSALFGIDSAENLSFTIVVHVATVLSTLVVLWREIWQLISGILKFKWNDEMRYFVNIIISMIPVAFVGLFFKDAVEEIFGSGLTIVGLMLLLTAALLAFSYYAKPRIREEISPLHAFIIGLAQACAVMPGLSRSGSTIATGLLLGNKKESLAQFSFLMVIPPILGEALLDITHLFSDSAVVNISVAAPETQVSFTSLVVGFLAAFVAGCLACKWMIGLVRKGKLIYFAAYCVVIAIVALIFA